jgi:hypothetical protein
MLYYKDSENNVHALESDEFEYLLPPGLVSITEIEAKELTAPTNAAPTVVTMRQARLALLQTGHLSAVNDAIAAMTGVAGEAARIEWDYASTVERGSQFVEGMAAELGLTDDDLDDLFALAATL